MISCGLSKAQVPALCQGRAQFGDSSYDGKAGKPTQGPPLFSQTLGTRGPEGAGTLEGADLGLPASFHPGLEGESEGQ